MNQNTPLSQKQKYAFSHFVKLRPKLLLKIAAFMILVLGAVIVFFHSSRVYARPSIQPAGNISYSSHATFKTIIIDNYSPYTFVNAEGQPDGFSVDLMQAVAQVMGFNLDIKVDNWDNARNALEKGEIDFLPMMAYSKERDKLYDFSPPHTIAYDAFFTQKNAVVIRSINDLQSKSIIVMKSDQAYDYLLSLGYIKTEQLILVESLPEALRLLASGKGDTALMPKLVGLTLIRDLKLANLELAPVVVEAYNRPFSFAVKDDNQAVLERLSQGMSIVKATGQYDEIYKKWFGTLEPRGLSMVIVLSYFGGAILASILIGVILLLWSFSLRKQVAARTKSLEIEIQERKQAEESLQESEERFKTMFMQAPLGIALIDSHSGHIHEVNPRFAEIAGRTMAEMIHIDWIQITHPDDVQADLDNMALLNAGLINGFQMEKRYIHLSGESVWINMTIAPLMVEDKDQPRHLCMIEDITRRKQAETEILKLNTGLEERIIERTSQLETTNKELEAFSYSISHDLRAPLRAITGYTNMLVEDYEPVLDIDGKRICSVISNEAQRMGQLIDDLLNFSRLSRKEMYDSTIDMQALTRDVFNELTTPETQGRIDLQIGELPSAKGDPALIHQVWINLFSNALKFTSRKERAAIEVGSDPSQEDNIYFVRDNGVGFDMQYADKLFGVFQRLHSEDEFKGTGVGLAIVQRIILRHGGRVWGESQPDKGAVFYFALPKKEDFHE